MVAFNPTPIINIPGYSDLSAVKAVDEFKVKSQNDRQQLDAAKDLVYLQGFNTGVMLVGEYAGKPVKDAKPLIREKLIAVSFLYFSF